MTDSERWGFTQHGGSERATIVSGFGSKEAAVAHAQKKTLVPMTIDVGRISRDENGRTQFEVVETVRLP